MSHDIYASMSAAQAAWTQLEVVANNLANSSTAGFKEQRVSFDLQGAMDDPLGDVYVGTELASPNFADGALVHDGVETHLALRGKGFFLAGEGGSQVLVRSGNFQLDSEGFLVTSSGLRVQGQGGSIQLLPEEQLTVASDGTILDQQGMELDKLRIVSAAQLSPLGGTSWRAETPAYEVDGVEIVQGALESSNTDPMRSMTELMEASRYFEAYQKAMQTSDQLDGMLNQMVGQ
jgi:flagellar basal-body rod protein FlgF